MYEGAVYSPKWRKKKKNRKRAGMPKYWRGMAVTLGVAGSLGLSLFVVEYFVKKGCQFIQVGEEQMVYSQAGEDLPYERLVIKQGETASWQVRDAVVEEAEDSILLREEQKETLSVKASLVLEKSGKMQGGKGLRDGDDSLVLEQQMEILEIEDSLEIGKSEALQEGQRLRKEEIVLSQKKQIEPQQIETAEQEMEDKIMYLTFDDGPDPKSTGRILDILKEREIKATFFVIGESVRRYPEIARRIVEEGHTIGIHCNHHDYRTLYKSVDSYLQDFEAAYEAVKEVTGVEAWLFRFPGGSINAYNRSVNRQIAEEMEKRGFVYYDWNAGLEDAVKDPVREELVANALETPLGRKRVVLLAHDTVDMTADCLEEILDGLSEYRMEVLTREVEAVQFRMQ